MAGGPCRRALDECAELFGRLPALADRISRRDQPERDVAILRRKCARAQEQVDGVESGFQRNARVSVSDSRISRRKTRRSGK